MDQSTAETLAALENIESVFDFELVYLFQTKAHMCYGCGIKNLKDNEQNNLIVRKYCEREYIFQGLRNVNIYLHIICIIYMHISIFKTIELRKGFQNTVKNF